MGILIENDKAPNNNKDIDNSTHKQIILQKIFKKEGTLSKDDIKLLNELNINLHNNGIFAIAVWKIQITERFVFPKCKNIKNLVGFEYDDLIYVFVGNVSEVNSALIQHSYLSEFASKIVENNNCILGLSNMLNNLMNIKDTIIEAVFSLSEGFYNEKTKINNIRSRKNVIKQVHEKWYFDYKYFFYQEIYRSLGKEQIEAFQKSLDYIEKNRVPAIKCVKMFCCEILHIIYERNRNSNTDLSKKLLENAKKHIEEAIFFTQVKEILLSFIKSNILTVEMDEKKLSYSILKAISYIRQHYNEPLALSQIAEEVNLNADYFSRIFREETGQTYSAFLSSIRLSKAESLLVNTSIKICDIAEAVGYANISYFSTVFKKRYGLNPFEFRRNIDRSLN